MLRFLNRVLACLVPLFIWSAPVSAQCPQPDGLDGGPCCTVANPQIPTFPRFDQDALEICWRNCAIDAVITYRASWKNINVNQPGVPQPCGERDVRLELRDAAAVLQWTGDFRRQYSRTWMETDPSGFPIQVWRFLVNGDMRPINPLIPCPVPPCVPAHGNRARFTGYIDYARNCALAPAFYQHAWMVSHVCDFVDHHAGFPRAGAFHPDRAYSFVGPAAGFVPAPVGPAEPAAAGMFEALRRRNLPPLGTVLPTTCDFEERLTYTFSPQNQFCLCAPPGANPQWQQSGLSITGACGSTVTTPGVPFLPGYLSMNVGTWTIGGMFPGVESLRWNVGGYDYGDPCVPQLRQEVFYGVTTFGGYPANQLLSTGVGAALPPIFLDQSNSVVPPAGLATIMNVPYVSDHFIMLNL